MPCFIYIANTYNICNDIICRCRRWSGNHLCIYMHTREIRKCWKGSFQTTACLTYTLKLIFCGNRLPCWRWEYCAAWGRINARRTTEKWCCITRANIQPHLLWKRQNARLWHQLHTEGVLQFWAIRGPRELGMSKHKSYSLQFNWHIGKIWVDATRKLFMLTNH